MWLRWHFIRFVLSQALVAILSDCQLSMCRAYTKPPPLNPPMTSGSRSQLRSRSKVKKTDFPGRGHANAVPNKSEAI